MFNYFLCFVPCAVKLNGRFIGTASENYSVLDADDGFVEFVPLSPLRSPVCMMLSKTPKSERNVKIIDLYGGFLIMPVFPRRLFSDFKLLGVKDFDTRYGRARLTCYAENGVRLIAETQNAMSVENIPFYPDDVRFGFMQGGSTTYALAILSSLKTAIIAYEIGREIKCVFKQIVDGYELNGNVLTVFVRKKDVMKHVVTEKWKFADRLMHGERVVTPRRKLYAINEKLVPYAFFEEIAAGGDVSAFLTPRLKPRADELKDFLGDFTAVLPPPHFRPQNEITLLYKDKVEYAVTELNSGLIDRVSLDEK